MTIHARAVEHYGKEVQIDKAIEECAEFIACAQQFREGRKTREDLAGEVADVRVMMEQMDIIIGDGLVPYAEAMKVARLDRRMREEDGLL